MKECKYIPTLETERLILRKLQPEDAEDFIDPRPNVKRKPTNDFLWGIELKETHEVIGIIEVFDVENERFGMVGYRIDPEKWDHGICTEAMKRVVDFIFTETQMDRLQGNANVKNTGSNRVLEKSGFQLEGTIRHGKMVSEYCDYNIWGLIREDLDGSKA